MTNYYSVPEKCKNPKCYFKSDDVRDYDEDGYCRNCSEIKSDMIKESSN